MNNSSVLARSPIIYPSQRHHRGETKPYKPPSSIDFNLPGFEQIFAPHGSTIVSQGAEFDSALYILSGWVLEEEVTCEGDVAWADIIMRGEVAGLNCVSSQNDVREKRKVATASISALTDVFAIRLPRRQIDRFSDEDRAFTRMLHETLRRQSAHLHDQLVALSAKTANDRVLMMLKSLQHRAQHAFGVCASARLPVSQVVLARIANISVVHMNRIAQKLRQEGVLDWSHEGVRFISSHPV
jgi:CRP-like cAMP-binding protein